MTTRLVPSCAHRWDRHVPETPGASIALGVQPGSLRQARLFRRSRVIVRDVRVSCFRFPPSPELATPAFPCCFCTSHPAHRSYRHSLCSSLRDDLAPEAGVLGGMLPCGEGEPTLPSRVLLTSNRFPQAQPSVVPASSPTRLGTGSPHTAEPIALSKHPPLCSPFSSDVVSLLHEGLGVKRQAWREAHTPGLEERKQVKEAWRWLGWRNGKQRLPAERQLRKKRDAQHHRRRVRGNQREMRRVSSRERPPRPVAGGRDPPRTGQNVLTWPESQPVGGILNRAIRGWTLCQTEHEAPIDGHDAVWGPWRIGVGVIGVIAR